MEITCKFHISSIYHYIGRVYTKTRSAKASSPTLAIQDYQYIIEIVKFLTMNGMKSIPSSAVAVRLKAADHK